MERVKKVKTKLDVLYNLQRPVKIKFSGLRRQSVTATKLEVQANSPDPSVLLQGVWSRLERGSPNKGHPLTFAKWPVDFLLNRQARVQINGEQGRSVPLKQGLPQRLPLLF